MHNQLKPNHLVNVDSSKLSPGKKAGLVVFLLIALCVVASITVSPYLCCYRLIHAVKNQDITTINELVDFPVLRDNVKARLRENITQRLNGDSSPRSGPFAIFGMAVGKIAADQLVDLYVSPSGFRSILQGVRPSRHVLITSDIDTATMPSPVTPSSNYNPGADKEFGKSKPNYKLGYTSFNTFEIDITKTTNEQERNFKLIMYRSGWYSWKLSDIQLSTAS